LKPITLFIDDVQFADHASLLLVGNMLFSAQGSPFFFILCHRDDEISMSASFKVWLSSISMFALEPIKLESITPLGVNDLISETLHLSPRMTHPLSSVLHRKTRGNPLFLRQLLDSLTEQGYIYIDLKHRRWAWDLDKIAELEISESVLALLMNDIQRLPGDLQYGLQIAACIGSCVTESMLNYLSIDLGLDLKDILQQASQKGFMIDMAGSTMFRFAHDKIQEAVYAMMPEHQRRENHMRLGLALCTQTLANSVEDEELFFAAVNQINQGGPTAVHEPSQMSVFAQLNLKAGRRSIELSDYNTALILFQHGISFLGDDDWVLNYQLSLELYDAAADASVILNKKSSVSFYTDCVVLHARCFEDKLHCKQVLSLLISTCFAFLTRIAYFSILIQVFAPQQKLSE
jgi:predicted ATPase